MAGRRYCEVLQGRGILCKEAHDDTIRIAPSLVITKDQIDWAMTHFADVLAGTGVTAPA